MKRLAFTLLLALAAFTPKRVEAQSPIIINYFCVAADYVFGERFQCYTQMTGFLVYAAMETVGHCTNNATPDAAENVFAACFDSYPTASAVGYSLTGDGFYVPGKVGAYATLSGVVGNPYATKTVDCYYVPIVSIQPILPC